MATRSEDLWHYLLDILKARGALPDGNLTPADIAQHADEILGGDRVRRFVAEYYYPRAYGQAGSAMSDEAAERLVAGLAPPAPAVPEERPAAPAAAPLRAVAVVGGGSYDTLAEALQAAPAGARISVAAGTYAGSLRIDRPVEIEGSGAVVLDAVGGCCVDARADRVVLKHVRLRYRKGPETGRALWVLQGELVLEDSEVEVEGAEDDGVVVLKAAVTLRRCRIRGGNHRVVLLERARGTLEDCDLEGTCGVGVTVRSGSEAVLERCRIHGGDFGMLVLKQSVMTVKQCQVTGFKHQGWEIEAGSRVVRPGDRPPFNYWWLLLVLIFLLCPLLGFLTFLFRTGAK